MILVLRTTLAISVLCMPGEVGPPFSTVRLGGFRNQEPGIAVALTGLFTVKIAGLEKVGFRKYYEIGIKVPWLLAVSYSQHGCHPGVLLLPPLKKSVIDLSA